MFEEFYGFKENPFNMTPDTKYLFYSVHHREAFAALKYGIENKKGFIVISGEVGTGKTTICRALLNQLDPSINVALILNPMMSETELLKSILDDLEIKHSGGTLKELAGHLNNYLLKEAAKNRNTVLIIDEAQDLSPKVLEQIRLLSNLETEKDKLLQIVLVGQPELMHILHKNELRQLRQRITVSYHLKALNREEVKRYILHRLEVAGGLSSITFSDKAIDMIYSYTKGIPRLINGICDKSLLVGYVREEYNITPPLIKNAIKEIEGYKFPVVQKKILPSIFKIFKYVFTGAAVGIIISAVLFLYLNRNIIKKYMTIKDNASYQINISKVVKENPKPVLKEQPEVKIPDDIDEIEAFEVFINTEHLKEIMLPRENFNGLFSRLFLTLRKNNLNYFFYSGNLGTIKDIGLPVFIRLNIPKKNEDYLLPIVAYKNDKFRVVFNKETAIDFSLEQIDRYFDGRAAIVYKADKNYIEPVLKLGDRGNEVIKLRKILNRFGYDIETKNKKFDSNLESIVKKFQKDHSLISDGVVGNRTSLLIYRLCTEGIDN